ncbi:MAG: ribosome maturation factor RimM [Pseudomonadota bacterium]
MTGTHDKTVVVGEIRGIYGVKGWVKLYSWTRPRENLLTYSTFVTPEGRTLNLLAGREQGKTLIGKFDGFDSRDDAEQAQGLTLTVSRSALPATAEAEGEYYWADLVGLTVVDEARGELGIVDHLLETGANDVMVLENVQGGQSLLPFVMGQVVKHVDLANGKIDVDWPGADDIAD